EFIVEKAGELGVSRIVPVLTKFSVVDKVNIPRLQNIAVEAAEQCERMDIALIEEITPLQKLLSNWDQNRKIIYGDESGASGNAKDLLPSLPQGKYAVLIGPEGGFASDELELLRKLPYTLGMCMGPRIMRADTATVAALTLLQAWTGDWQNKPAFRNS
ncbi:MAG: RsmE family RNA methyltransferase, partial [Pseudomonadota bacterium]